VTFTVWTVGHSTRTATEFHDVLAAYGIELVVDVRRFPGSRSFPQFARPALEVDLPAAGVSYQWLPALGGRRSPQPDSPNDGWRHRAFRGYADHVHTEEFAGGLMELLMLGHGLRTVVMCAEVLWWRCHRRLIADVLTTLGVSVEHIRDAALAEPHRLTAPAHLVDGALSYRRMDEPLPSSD